MGWELGVNGYIVSRWLGIFVAFSCAVGMADRPTVLDNYDDLVKNLTRKPSPKPHADQKNDSANRYQDSDVDRMPSRREEIETLPRTEEEPMSESEIVDEINDRLSHPPVLDTEDPNYLDYTATNGNFSLSREPGGAIPISEGTPENTCIIILNINDGAMSYFRQTFTMYGGRYQNASNVDEAIQAIWNCQEAMGGYGAPIEHLVFATHGFSNGYTQLGLITSGKMTRKLIDALNGKPVQLTMGGVTQTYQGGEVPVGNVRFLSCLVARGVGNGTHLLTQLSAGLPGIKGQGPPKVTAWDQVMWSGPGHISSQGNKITVQAIDNRPQVDNTQLAMNESSDDAIGAENPVDSDEESDEGYEEGREAGRDIASYDDDEIMTETPRYGNRLRGKGIYTASVPRKSGTSFHYVFY